MNHRITDTEADALARSFRAALGDAPALHPLSSHLPTRDEALAVAAKHAVIGVICLPVPDDDDLGYCGRCNGDGWLDNGDGTETECTCGEALS